MIHLKIYREANGKQIPGVSLSAFIHNGGTYFFTGIKVYKDGMIDCWELVSFDRFIKKVRQGWVVTTIPEGAEVSLSGLIAFKAGEVMNFVKEEEFVKEVADEIERLNGRTTSADKCREAYKEFLEKQTEDARERLREAYESIPEHNRRYVLGDQDVKDIPVRMIIYGEDEIENWSHRIASRKLGLKPLPTIKVPGVKSESEKNKKKEKSWWKIWA